jgi:hypothetical protein
MGSPTHYACCGKEMLGWIRERMATQESTPGGGRFSTSGSTVVGNDASASSNPCAPSGDYSTNQPRGWGPTPSRFSPHNVECKKGWSIICSWLSLENFLLVTRLGPTCKQDTCALQGYVVREWKLFMWHQLCAVVESSDSVSMWQHAIWSSARFVERCPIHKKTLSRLQFGEGRRWRALAPCQSKYTES